MSLLSLKDPWSDPTLEDLGERLAGQFAELSARPSIDGCDHLVMSLAQASTAVARMRTRLERDKSA